MSEWNYVYGAYGLVWGTLLGYTFYLIRRYGRATRALAELQSKEGGTR
jgi:CcmD family protein